MSKKNKMNNGLHRIIIASKLSGSDNKTLILPSFHFRHSCSLMLSDKINPFMAGIYIHIPFCKQACYYCDFHFSTNQQIRTEVVEAISKEILIQKDYLEGEPIHTIYLGGGTPSLLSKHELSLIFDTICSTQTVISPEITLEANPDDLTVSKLEELLQVGVNRLSIGIQSFHSTLLTLLHRAHNASTAITSFQTARHVGFKNISIDLIYGIPGESESMWLEDIHRAIDLDPEHLSCYSLTIEEKTVFGRWAAAGKLQLVEEEVAARHLEMLMRELGHAGYEHYEISNFAKTGFYSKHNSSYWKQERYLGIGPSAHSFNGMSRQFNVTNNNLYVKALQQDKVPYEKEELTTENKINEYILTTLRTSWGTDLKKINQEFGYDILNKNTDYLSRIMNNGLATLETDVLRLTQKGKLMADKISSDLFVMSL
jgi:oxygen-independent coproporphyrinogen-3 oxidase